MCIIILPSNHLFKDSADFFYLIMPCSEITVQIGEGCIVVNWCLLYSTIKANGSDAELFLHVLENFFYLTENYKSKGDY